MRAAGAEPEKDRRLFGKEMAEKKMERIAEGINVLGKFCGMRDVEALTREGLRERYGFDRADVMVLFGGSILCGADVLAQAMEEGIARTYIIVGGEGHTTETLRQKVREECPQIVAEGRSEAEVFQQYLGAAYGKKADYLETESTNCGNNITYLLALLQRHAVACKSIILCQDASMQRRMDAGLRKYAPEDMKIINFAAYRAEVTSDAGRLTYATQIHGMWEPDRYVNLLMGEIPRLTDGPEGYGPKGKGFIAHVDIPEEVTGAFEELKQIYKDAVREANPLYASK